MGAARERGGRDRQTPERTWALPLHNVTYRYIPLHTVTYRERTWALARQCRGALIRMCEVVERMCEVVERVYEVVEGAARGGVRALGATQVCVCVRERRGATQVCV